MTPFTAAHPETGDPARGAPDLRLPSRYVPVRLLGQGGQGSVWEARDRRDGRSVALKIVAPDASGPAADRAADLAREFEVLSRVVHPAIARVLDFGRLGPTGENSPAAAGVYFTSELIEGVDVLEWFVHNAIEAHWDAARSIAEQALGALHGIHRAGYIHGDVKPSHLLVTGDPGDGPRVKLVDFGSAALSAGDPSRWTTPAYRPPADLGGDGRARDLYALGLTLFHAFAGRLPFEIGDDRAMSRWKAAGRPARLSEWLRDPPPALERLIAGLTATAAGERFEDALDALRVLGRRTVLRFDRTRPLGDTAMHGRDADSEGIVGALEAGAATVLLSGPRGSGTTRLASAVASALQVRGWSTVSIRSGEITRGLGELIDVAGAPASLVEGGGDGEEDGPVALLEALSRKRVLAVVDSWPFADEPGADRLERLLRAHALRRRRRNQPAFLVVVRGGAGGAGDASDSPLAHLHASGGAVHCRLEALDRETTGRLLADLFQTGGLPDDLVDFVHRLSGGLPERIRRAARLLLDDGVEVDQLGIARVCGDWRRRLERLDARREDSATAESVEARVLEAFALLDGLAVSPATAHQLLGSVPSSAAGLSPVDWRRAIETLRADGDLLAAPDGRVRIAGQRAAPDDRASAALREAVARRALEAESRGALVARDADDATALARLAATCAHDRERATGAARRALRAARRLRRQRRHWEAARLVGEIGERLASRLDERDRVALALRRAQLCAASGHTTEALGVLENVRRDGPLSMRLAALEARLLEETGRLDEAIETLRPLAEALGAPDGNGLRRPRWYLLQAWLADLCVAATRGDLARGHLAHGEDLLDAVEHGRPEVEDPEMVEAIGRFGRVHSALDDRRSAARFLDATRRLAARTGRQEVEAGALEALGALHGRAGRFDESEAAFRAALELAERRGDRLGELRASVNLATLRFRAGEHDAARTLFEQAESLSRSLGPSRYAVPILIGLEAIARERGDLLGALRLLRRILQMESASHPIRIANALFNLGDIYLALGRPDRAERVRSRALEAFRRAGATHWVGLAHVGLAAVHLALGEIGRARAALREARECGAGEPDRVGPSLLAHESWAALLERRPERRVLESCGEAIRRSLGSGDSISLELAILALVEALLGHDRRRGARNALEGWRRQSARRGARPIAGRWGRLREAYELVTTDAPGAAAGVRRAVDDARAAANLREALLIATLAARHLDPAAQTELDVVAADLAGRFLRRVRPATRERFRRAYLEPSPGVAGAGVAGAARSPMPAGGGALSGTRRELGAHAELAGRWASIDDDALLDDAVLAAELDQLRIALRADAVWIINGEIAGEPPALAARSCAERPVDALVTHRDRLERARRTSDPVVADGDVFMSIPVRGERRRVLHVELSPETVVEEGELGVVTALLGLLLAGRDRARELAEERRRGCRRDDELRALHSRFAREKSQLETALITQRGGGGIESRVVSSSPAIRELVDQLQKLAQSDIPVLLVGEHGVGKDFFARRIHALGPRAGRPFLSEVCEVPESLLESELFGSVRGAFTGADEDRPGLLVSCRGGTLYLDRIDELAPALQARLVRAIEEKRVRPVGGSAPVPIDVRLISSSCIDIDELERSAGFRKDLLFRVRGAVLRVPPLRERPEDLLELFRLLLEQHAIDLGIDPPEITPGVEERLRERSWPGNVRELDNVARRLLLDGPARVLPRHVADVAEGVGRPGAGGRREAASDVTPGRGRGRVPDAALLDTDHGDGTDLQEARRRFEAAFIERVLTRCRGNATEAARCLGVSRRHLGTLLARYGLDPKAFRGRG